VHLNGVEVCKIELHLPMFVRGPGVSELVALAMALEITKRHAEAMIDNYPSLNMCHFFVCDADTDSERVYDWIGLHKDPVHADGEKNIPLIEEVRFRLNELRGVIPVTQVVLQNSKETLHKSVHSRAKKAMGICRSNEFTHGSVGSRYMTQHHSSWQLSDRLFAAILLTQRCHAEWDGNSLLYNQPGCTREAFVVRALTVARLKDAGWEKDNFLASPRGTLVVVVVMGAKHEEGWAWVRESPLQLETGRNSSTTHDEGWVFLNDLRFFMTGVQYEAECRKLNCDRPG